MSWWHHGHNSIWQNFFKLLFTQHWRLNNGWNFRMQGYAFFTIKKYTSTYLHLLPLVFSWLNGGLPLQSGWRKTSLMPFSVVGVLRYFYITVVECFKNDSNRKCYSGIASFFVVALGGTFIGIVWGYILAFVTRWECWLTNSLVNFIARHNWTMQRVFKAFVIRSKGQFYLL